MPPDPPFAELISRLREGDPATASLIFDRYVKRLVCLAGSHLPRILAPKLDPEDVVQSVFRSFFRRHREGQFLLKNWDGLWNLLAVLAVRKCGEHLDYFRAARRDIRREAIAEETPPSADSPEMAAAPTPTPLEAVLLADTLAKVLQDLPPEQRLILQLRLEGYTVEEISDRLQRTERTVYRLLEKVRVGLNPSLAYNASRESGITLSEANHVV